MEEKELDRLYGLFDEYISSFGPENSYFGEKKSHELVMGLEVRIKENVFPMIESGNLEEAFNLVTWVYVRLLKYYYLFDYSWQTLAEIIDMTWFKIRAKADDLFIMKMNNRVWELHAEYNDISDGALAIWSYLYEIIETTAEQKGFLDWTLRSIDNGDIDKTTETMLVNGAACMMEELGYPETEIDRYLEAHEMKDI